MRPSFGSVALLPRRLGWAGKAIVYAENFRGDSCQVAVIQPERLPTEEKACVTEILPSGHFGQYS